MEKYSDLDFFVSRGFCKLSVRVLLLMVSLFFSATTQAQTRKCSYCDGNGTIVRHLTVSQYGVRNEAKKSVLHVVYIIILHQDILTFIVNTAEEPA